MLFYMTPNSFLYNGEYPIFSIFIVFVVALVSFLQLFITFVCLFFFGTKIDHFLAQNEF